jgi:hypothetical protein
MQTVIEYLERAQQFERLAAEAEDEDLKQVLMAQAEGYRIIAARRADQIGVPMPRPLQSK